MDENDTNKNDTKKNEAKKNEAKKNDHKKNDHKKNIKKSYYIKIILLGEQGTGKTNLINVYFDKPFKPGEDPNITPTQSFQSYDSNNNKYNITFWDTMGQERYRSITKTYIKGSNIIIFVYDITRRDTFFELNYWLSNVNEELQNEEVIFGVAANKIDLFAETQVGKEEGEKYAKAINALFCETSAKDNPKRFKAFVKELLDNLYSNEVIMKKIEEIENDDSFHLHNKKKKKKNCC